MRVGLHWCTIKPVKPSNKEPLFREDSDIFMPYGEVVSRNRTTDPAVQSVGSKILDGKTGLIAWFVSHCRTTSRREDLVEELKLLLPNDSVTVTKEKLHFSYFRLR